MIEGMTGPLMSPDDGKHALKEELEGYRSAVAIPGESDLESLLVSANSVLATENAAVRPRDTDGVPGGLVELEKELPTVLIPDLHARPGLLTAALGYPFKEGVTVLDALVSGSIQLVCLGDYFHGEGRVKQRWKRALAEFSNGFLTHLSMDQEMVEGLAVLMMIARLKSALPSEVHLLKGNHENVANESGNGNHPFGKFAYEGEMVLEYLRLTYSEGLIERIAEFEKRLPLLAIGRHFIVSHAEPARFFLGDEVIGYRHQDEVVYGLTWTDNDEAEPDAVERMLDAYLGKDEAPTAFHFGGHRAVAGTYQLRAGGRYVQIHNPSRYIMALLVPDRPVDLAHDIIDLGPIEDASDGQT
jgi:hypothetical protein